MDSMKRILCRRLLKEAVRGSQHSKKYGLGTVLPVDEAEPLVVAEEDARGYAFYQRKKVNESCVAKRLPPL